MFSTPYILYIFCANVPSIVHSAGYIHSSVNWTENFVLHDILPKLTFNGGKKRRRRKRKVRGRKRAELGPGVHLKQSFDFLGSIFFYYSAICSLWTAFKRNDQELFHRMVPCVIQNSKVIGGTEPQSRHLT